MEHVKVGNINIVSKISTINFLPSNYIYIQIYTIKQLKMVTTFLIRAEKYALSSPLEDVTDTLLELKERELK